METRNLILAIVLSALILITFNFLQPPPRHPVAPPPVAETEAGTAATPGPPGLAGGPLASREDVLARSPRIRIATPLLTGSIALKGAHLDDLTLTAYHEAVDPGSPAIVLLSPSGAVHSYVAEQGWIAPGQAVRLPDDETLWTADRDTLTVATPVTLSWDNGAGLHFARVISIDENYMFTVRQSVTNDGPAPVTLRPFVSLARGGPPPAAQGGWWTISYEGPIGAFDGVEEDVKYTAIADDAPVRRHSTGGWLGFSDKYWLGAIAPLDQHSPIEARFLHAGTGEAQRWQIDFVADSAEVPAGGSATVGTLIFAGPKEVNLLSRYRDSLGLLRFDNAVDFGWFWFFTKPIFYLLDRLYQATGNFGIAILLMTVIMRIVFFPLQTRAVISMNKMKLVQPEALKLRELYGDDKVKLNQETMALYKRAGANPLGGCLPIVLQIPVFFSLYKVLYVTIEMRHAPFYGWIHDLSAPDPTNLWNLFGLIPWTAPHFLPQLGVWPIVYCASMYFQQRMNPAPPDPVQARMMQFMPLMFMFMLGNFASGLVIYWTWSNILVILQQYVITRHVAPLQPLKT